MRKVLVILLAVLLMGGTAFARTGPGGPGDIMGQGKFDVEPHRTFRLIRWEPLATAGATLIANAPSLTADSIVVWDINSDDGVTVTTTTTSGDTAVAGVIPIAIKTPETAGQTATQDVGKRNWGYVQTYGLAEVTMAVTAHSAATAGYALGTSVENGKAGVYECPGAGNANKLGNAGVFLGGGAAAATNVDVFLK